MNKAKLYLKLISKGSRRREFFELRNKFKKIKKSRLFFFFPFYHVGGAERVHLDILHTVADQNPVVFFTSKSDNAAFLAEFESVAYCMAIYPPDGNKYVKEFFYTVLTQIINNKKDAVVFGCNSYPFYDLLPNLGHSVKKIDLLHAFTDPNPGLEEYSIPCVALLDKRVVINKKTLADFKSLYKQHSILNFFDRIKLIYNYTPIPANLPFKEANEQLKMLYIGRGSEEKRVHLIGRLATALVESGYGSPSIQLIGEVRHAVNDNDFSNCKFLGEISDRQILQEYLSKADILVMSSRREGFPMVIMEAMAHGCIPVTTNVGGIGEHVSHMQNGVLINSISEGQIIKDLHDAVLTLSSNNVLKKQLSKNAYQYARENFNKTRFKAEYRALFSIKETGKLPETGNNN